MKVQAVLFDLDGVIINSGADIALSVNAALEAFGMDFLGKIHVLESAIAFSDLVEINSAGGIVTGFPVKIEKSAGDAVLVLQSDDVKNADIKNGTESQKISVAQARSVKRIRSSVLGRTK